MKHKHAPEMRVMDLPVDRVGDYVGMAYNTKEKMYSFTIRLAGKETNAYYFKKREANKIAKFLLTKLFT